jgi:hypothetical protein
VAITATFTLMFSLNTHTFAFHENLGIDDNKASELYHTNPNDPAILQWKSALQSAISGMDKCFTIQEAISCQSLISTIISNCKSHPNTLLACNDNRLPLYPSILKQAQEAQKKAEEEQKKAAIVREQERAKANALKVQKSASDIIDKCIIDSLNPSSKFDVASPICIGELRSLLQTCNMSNMTASLYNYCKDERFVGYLKEQKIMNATASP